MFQCKLVMFLIKVEICSLRSAAAIRGPTVGLQGFDVREDSWTQVQGGFKGFCGCWCKNLGLTGIRTAAESFALSEHFDDAGSSWWTHLFSVTWRTGTGLGGPEGVLQLGLDIGKSLVKRCISRHWAYNTIYCNIAIYLARWYIASNLNKEHSI